mgnify:CR=1 FL=1
MTQTEISALRAKPNKTKKEESMCSLYNMLNSVLTYCSSRDPEVIKQNTYIKEYMAELKDNKLANEIVEEQCKYFAGHVIVHQNSYESSDGGWYNSIEKY